MHLLWWIIVGLVAGWATGKIMRRRFWTVKLSLAISLAAFMALPALGAGKNQVPAGLKLLRIEAQPPMVELGDRCGESLQQLLEDH